MGKIKYIFCLKYGNPKTRVTRPENPKPDPKPGALKTRVFATPKLYPTLHFTNIINLKKSLHKQNLLLQKCCSEGPICIKKFQY